MTRDQIKRQQNADVDKDKVDIKVQLQDYRTSLSASISEDFSKATQRNHEILKRITSSFTKNVEILDGIQSSATEPWPEQIVSIDGTEHTLGKIMTRFEQQYIDKRSQLNAKWLEYAHVTQQIKALAISLLSEDDYEIVEVPADNTQQDEARNGDLSQIEEVGVNDRAELDGAFDNAEKAFEGVRKQLDKLRAETITENNRIQTSCVQREKKTRGKFMEWLEEVQDVAPDENDEEL